MPTESIPIPLEHIQALANADRRLKNARLAVEGALFRHDLTADLVRVRHEAEDALESAILRVLLSANVAGGADAE